MPPLRHDPYRPQHPPSGTSWWTRKFETREDFDAENRKQAERMNAVQTTQHVQRKQGDR